jgi:two-component system, NtrC family, nitrogen regulation sensor histidine kinase NtrY
MEPNPHPPRRGLVIFLLIIVPTLLFLAWSQASLNLSFIQPGTVQQTVVLVALSLLISIAFVIFALILIRNLLKLYVERRQQQLGSRFKVRMVAAFLGLSLVPVCFLFAFAYGLLNRSIDKWFGAPFDVVRKSAGAVVGQLESEEEQRVLHASGHLASHPRLIDDVARHDGTALDPLLAAQAKELGLQAVLCFDARGNLLSRAGDSQPRASEIVKMSPAIAFAQAAAGGEIVHWGQGAAGSVLAARPVVDSQGERLGTVVGIRRLPGDMAEVVQQMQSEIQKYDELSHVRKIIRLNYLAALGLLTLLILFAATWFALFLSKQVTVPIQALAEGTHEVSKGNLGYQVTVPASGELRILIRSFNEMTRQLQENRRAIEQAARELQRANRELEERGNTMEAILENIPTGVISFDPEGQITRMNSTVERMFGRTGVTSARKLTDLFAPEDARDIARLFRRAARQGVVSQQMELNLGGRRAAVALTLTSIRARHGAVGSVLVLEDLTELLRAQKAAAWREVAQRLAHEIKNPLTPIQLSAERIGRLLERASNGVSGDLVATIEESAALIEREVEALKTLVDEFSHFARFPASRPVPSSLNAIIENALRVFDGRLTGISVREELAPDLPPVQVDPEQMKRVLVNLIDNAAEALEQSALKEIWIRTALDQDRDVVELVVADSGPGILPDAKEKLFLPYFSTKLRGTGLGLAIVNHIVSEHHGSIRVEKNRPTGSQFIIELPVERMSVADS